MALNSRNAWYSVSPNILGRYSPRAWPSPCSPDSEPPKLTTRSAASSMKALKFSMPVGGVQVEADAAVDAALAEVAVERRIVVVLVEQLAQVAQVCGRPFPAARPSLPSRARCRAGPAPRRSSPGRPRAPSRSSALVADRRTASWPAGCRCFFSASMQRRACSSASSLLSPPNSTIKKPFALAAAAPGRRSRRPFA